MPTRYSGGLHDETLKLLERRSRNLTYFKICEELGLTIGWLRQFARDTEKKADPGVNKVEKLHAYLTAQEAIRLNPNNDI